MMSQYTSRQKFAWMIAILVVVLYALIPIAWLISLSLKSASTIGTDTSFFPTIFFAYFAIGLGIGSAFMPLLSIAMADLGAISERRLARLIDPLIDGDRIPRDLADSLLEPQEAEVKQLERAGDALQAWQRCTDGVAHGFGQHLPEHGDADEREGGAEPDACQRAARMAEQTEQQAGGAERSDDRACDGALA